LEVYGEIEELSRYEKESGRFDEFIPKLLNCWGQRKGQNRSNRKYVVV
jgi:hypothetical protein